MFAPRFRTFDAQFPGQRYQIARLYTERSPCREYCGDTLVTELSEYNVEILWAFEHGLMSDARIERLISEILGL